MSTIKTVIVIILLIGFGTLVTMAYRGCKLHKQVQQVSAGAIAKTDTGVHTRDADSLDHLTKQSVIANDLTATILYKPMFDSACRELGVAHKQITDLQKTVFELKGRAEAPVKVITIHDSTGVMPDGWHGDTFTWADSSVSITGYVERGQKVDTTCAGDTCAYEDGKATIFYDIVVSVTSKKYWKRKHKLLGLRYGRKIYYIDANASNKNIRITGLTDLQINN